MNTYLMKILFFTLLITTINSINILGFETIPNYNVKTLCYESENTSDPYIKGFVNMSYFEEDGSFINIRTDSDYCGKNGPPYYHSKTFNLTDIINYRFNCTEDCFLQQLACDNNSFEGVRQDLIQQCPYGCYDGACLKRNFPLVEYNKVYTLDKNSNLAVIDDTNKEKVMKYVSSNTNNNSCTYYVIQKEIKTRDFIQGVNMLGDVTMFQFDLVNRGVLITNVTNKSCSVLFYDGPGCNDSDNTAYIIDEKNNEYYFEGNDFYKKGNITLYDDLVISDSCRKRYDSLGGGYYHSEISSYEGDILEEYACNNNKPHKIQITCETGCKDGACIKENCIDIRHGKNETSGVYTFLDSKKEETLREYNYTCQNPSTIAIPNCFYRIIHPEERNYSWPYIKYGERYKNFDPKIYIDFENCKEGQICQEGKCVEKKMEINIGKIKPITLIIIGCDLVIVIGIFLFIRYLLKKRPKQYN